MNATIENIMTSVVVCANVDYSVTEVMDIMDTEELHCLPVIDNSGHCVGIISGTDLLRWHKLRKRSSDVDASEILSQPVITISPDVAILEATKLMVKNKVHHLIVVDQGELVGIVSAMDVLEQFLSVSDPNWL